MVCMDYMTSKLYLIPFTRTLIGTSKRINQYTNYHTKYCVQTDHLLFEIKSNKRRIKELESYMEYRKYNCLREKNSGH